MCTKTHNLLENNPIFEDLNVYIDNCPIINQINVQYQKYVYKMFNDKTSDFKTEYINDELNKEILIFNIYNQTKLSDFNKKYNDLNLNDPDKLNDYINNLSKQHITPLGIFLKYINIIPRLNCIQDIRCGKHKTGFINFLKKCVTTVTQDNDNLSKNIKIIKDYIMYGLGDVPMSSATESMSVN